jgi:hypothetical protein
VVSPDRYASTARATAHAILRGPPFVTPHRAPGLWQRIADDVGHAIASAVRWLFDQFRRFFTHPVAHVAHSAFGNNATLAEVGLVACVVAVVAAVLVRRARPSKPPDDEDAEPQRRQRRASALLARAAAARAAGDLDLALRLRFEAGLEHLEARGMVRERTTLTSGAIAAQVQSPTFDELAAVHTLVAYAGVPASDRDVDDAFERWPEVARPRRVPVGAR